MNLLLQDPLHFEKDYPEVVEQKLEGVYGHRCAFNRFGTLLAVGCIDGQVKVYDFETRDVVKVLGEGDNHGIAGLRWSRSGRYIMCASFGGTLRIWNVASGELFLSHKFDRNIVHAQMHCTKVYLCLVTLNGQEPHLVDLRQPTAQQRLLHTFHASAHAGSAPATSAKPGVANLNTFAWFNQGCDKIFVGSSRGQITVFHTRTRSLLLSISLPNAPTVQFMTFSACHKYCLVNSSDGVLRLFRCEGGPPARSSSSALTASHSPPFKLEKVREYRDVIDSSTRWKDACFSKNSEYVIAAQTGSSNRITIWNRETGAHEHTLDGTNDGILNIAWHPMRACLVSCTEHGDLYVWAQNLSANWAAFAPDFEELAESVVYEEPENEFEKLPQLPDAVQSSFHDNTEKYDVRSLTPSVPSDIDALDKFDALEDADLGHNGVGIDPSDLVHLPLVPETDWTARADATVPKGDDLKRAIEEAKAREEAEERQRQQEMAAAAMLLEQQKQEERRLEEEKEKQRQQQQLMAQQHQQRAQQMLKLQRARAAAQAQATAHLYAHPPTLAIREQAKAQAAQQTHQAASRRIGQLVKPGNTTSQTGQTGGKTLPGGTTGGKTVPHTQAQFIQQQLLHQQRQHQSPAIGATAAPSVTSRSPLTLSPAPSATATSAPTPLALGGNAAASLLLPPGGQQPQGQGRPPRAQISNTLTIPAPIAVDNNRKSVFGYQATMHRKRPPPPTSPPNQPPAPAGQPPLKARRISPAAANPAAVARLPPQPPAPTGPPPHTSSGSPATGAIHRTIPPAPGGSVTSPPAPLSRQGMVGMSPPLPSNTLTLPGQAPSVGSMPGIQPLASTPNLMPLSAPQASSLPLQITPLAGNSMPNTITPLAPSINPLPGAAMSQALPTPPTPYVATGVQTTPALAGIAMSNAFVPVPVPLAGKPSAPMVPVGTQAPTAAAPGINPLPFGTAPAVRTQPQAASRPGGPSAPHFPSPLAPHGGRRVAPPPPPPPPSR